MSMTPAQASSDRAAASVPGLYRLGLRPAAARPRRHQLIGHGRTVQPRSFSADSGTGSFDSDDKLDYNLSRELQQLADRDKYAKLQARLELLYKVQEASSKPEKCQCCRGTGEQECEWCHGTGAMTVGDVLYCSNQGCSPCPVCRGTGSCKCPNCRGTGKRASWLS